MSILQCKVEATESRACPDPSRGICPVRVRWLREHGLPGAGPRGAGWRVTRPGDRVPSCLVVGSRVVCSAGRACRGARTRRALSRASRPVARNARECAAGGAAVSHGGFDIDECNSWPPGWWWPAVCMDVGRLRDRSRAGLPSDVHDCTTTTAEAPVCVAMVSLSGAAVAHRCLFFCALAARSGVGQAKPAP